VKHPPKENKMKKSMRFFLLIFASISSSIVALDTNDNQAIHHIIENFANTWNDHEGQGFADYYTQDAYFVNIFGMTFVGKQEIEERHTKILESILKGSTFEVTDIKFREAKPDVVIALVYWKVSNIQKPGNETLKGIFTHVILKNQENWE